MVTSVRMIEDDGTELEMEPYAAHRYLVGALPVVNTGKNANDEANRLAFWIWMAVLGILGLTILVFGSFALVAQGQRTGLFLAPASTALGAIAGLLSPSPGETARKSRGKNK